MASKQKPVDVARSRLEIKVKDVKEVAQNVHKIIDSMFVKSVKEAQMLLEEKGKARFLANYPSASHELETSLSQLLLAADKLSHLDDNADIDSDDGGTADTVKRGGEEISSPKLQLDFTERNGISNGSAGARRSPNTQPYITDRKRTFSKASLSSASSYSGSPRTLDPGIQVKPFPWQEGVAYPVAVMETKNPWDFSVQVLSSTLMDLMDNVCVLYSKEARSGYKGGVTRALSAGLFCCAKSPEDGAWYRAMIRKVFRNRTHQQSDKKCTGSGASSLDEKCPGVTVKAFLIDEGVEIVVDLASIRPLDPVYALLPAQSLRCLLAGVQPVVSSSLSEEFNFDELYDAWSSRAACWFRSVVKSVNVLTAFFSMPPKYLDGDPHYIDPEHIACDLYVTSGQFWSLEAAGRPPIQQHVGYLMLQEMLARSCDVFQSELLTPQSRAIIQSNSELDAIEGTPVAKWATRPCEIKAIGKCSPSNGLAPQKVSQAVGWDGPGRIASYEDTRSQSTASVSGKNYEASVAAGSTDGSPVTSEGETATERESSTDHARKCPNAWPLESCPSISDGLTYRQSGEKPVQTMPSKGSDSSTKKSRANSSCADQPCSPSDKTDCERAADFSPSRPPLSLRSKIPQVETSEGGLANCDGIDSVIGDVRGSACISTFDASCHPVTDLSSDGYMADLPREEPLAPMDSVECLVMLQGTSALPGPTVEGVISHVAGDTTEGNVRVDLLADSLQFPSDSKAKENLVGSTGTCATGTARLLVWHVESPSLFYANLVAADTSFMDECQKALEEFCACKEAEVRCCDCCAFTIGTPVAARCSLDSAWHRAVVISMEACQECEKAVSGDKSESSTVAPMCEVLYMDFGFKEWIVDADILPLADELLNLPRETICCCLADVQPLIKGSVTSDKLGIEGDESPERSLVKVSAGSLVDPVISGSSSDGYAISTECWSDASISRFKDLVLTERPLLATLKSSRKGGPTGAVLRLYLRDASDDAELCINDLMVAEGLARSTLDVSCKGFSASSEPCEAEDIKTNSVEPRLSAYQGKKAMTSHLAPVSEHITDERSLVGIVGEPSERAFHRRGLDLQGTVAPWYDIPSQVVIPAVGDWVAVAVTSLYDAVHFSVNFPFGTQSVDSLLKAKGRDNITELEEDGDLRHLQNAMRKYYSNLPKRSHDVIPPAKGELVAAKRSMDNAWYRARTTSTNGDCVTVFFVDVGDTASISLVDCHELLPEFLRLPFQAVEGCLANVELMPDVKSNDTILTRLRQEFRRLTKDKILLAQIISNTTNRCVALDLYDTTVDGQPHINELLLQQQGVRPCAMPC